MYLIGVRLLKELSYDSSRISEEEWAAINKTKDVLSRLYAQECLADIDYGMDVNNKSCHLEYFCDETVERIDAYNTGGENSIEEFIAEQRRRTNV